MERASVANSEEQLLGVLARLDECRVTLVAAGNGESAQLVALAILDIRMRLNRIGDGELQALCDEMLPDGGGLDRARESKPQVAERPRPLLRVVK